MTIFSTTYSTSLLHCTYYCTSECLITIANHQHSLVFCGIHYIRSEFIQQVDSFTNCRIHLWHAHNHGFVKVITNNWFHSQPTARDILSDRETITNLDIDRSCRSIKRKIAIIWKVKNTHYLKTRLRNGTDGWRGCQLDDTQLQQ